MATIPDTFVDLATAYRSPQQSMRNVIGIVVDLMAPTVTRTGDHMVTFKLMDPSIRDGVFDDKGSQVNGLKVRFFRPDQNFLPQVKQQGDIMVLKNIKMSVFGQQPVAISNNQTRAVVYPITNIHDSNTAMLYKPMVALGHPDDVFWMKDQETNYVIQLKRDMRSAYYDLPPPSASAPAVKKYRYPGDDGPTTEATAPVQPRPVFGSKFRFVKDLRHGEFADICGHVVKKFSGGRGTELYVTDYTENKDMFFYRPPEMMTNKDRDGDDYGYTVGTKKNWTGPYGHLVLKVNTKDPHATYASNFVKEGDFVLLKNVKMKIMADGANLEGDMWPDNKNPDKVQIEKSQRVIASPQVDEIEKRKERYWASRAAKTAANGDSEEQELSRTEKRNQTKNQKKSQKKKEKKLQKRDAAAAGQESADGNEAEAAVQIVVATEKGLNPNIRCGNQEVPIRTIRFILDLDNKIHTGHKDGKTQVYSFVNVRYRTRARVIDYMPKKIEDFTMPADHPKLGPPTNPYSSQTHEWCFQLLLEDATKPKASIDANLDTVWVGLHHEEAQYLFGNNVGDPKDLRKDAALLAKVKQQLFLLWGNLEEKKDDEELSNLPFECCLMEHGVPMNDSDPRKATIPFGYIRLYAMFGTTIL